VCVKVKQYTYLTTFYSLELVTEDSSTLIDVFMCRCTYLSGCQHHSGWNSTAEQDSQAQWQAVQTQSNCGSGM